METVYREKIIKVLLERFMELESINSWRGSEIERLKAENEYLRRKIEQYEQPKSSANVFEEV